MKRLCALMVVAGALAACGGKSKPATAVANTGGATDGVPFDQAAVQAKLAAAPQNAACNGADSGSLQVLYDEQKTLLTEGGPVDESFACHSVDTDVWECTWSVFSKPSGAPDPDDPCAEGGSSGYQIIVRVDRAGTLDEAGIVCVAPG